MPASKSKKRGLKIFLILFGTLLLILVISLALFFIPWAKRKTIAYVEDHSEYSLKISSVAFTGLHSLSIKGVELRPKLDVKEFYEVDNTERDWIALKTHISIEGIHWGELLWNKKVYADKVCVTESDLYIYHDKNMPDAPYQFKPLHSHLIRNAHFPITFPLVELAHGRIEYNEKPDNGGSTGKVVFSKLYGSLYHFSTDSGYIAQQPEITLDGKGMIMDSIDANMKYKIFTLSKNNRFTFEGHVRPFSAEVFNKCITPMLGAEIRSGKIEKVSLFFQADDSLASGTIDMEYKELKVDMLSKKNPGKILLIKTMGSRLIVNKNSSKHESGENKVGKIYSPRNSGSSVFNYWWSAIKSGLVSSLVKIHMPVKKIQKQHSSKQHK